MNRYERYRDRYINKSGLDAVPPFYKNPIKKKIIKNKLRQENVNM
jgi:hypothetical protein